MYANAGPAQRGAGGDCASPGDWARAPVARRSDAVQRVQGAARGRVRCGDRHAPAGIPHSVGGHGLESFDDRTVGGDLRCRERGWRRAQHRRSRPVGCRRGAREPGVGQHPGDCDRDRTPSDRRTRDPLCGRARGARDARLWRRARLLGLARSLSAAGAHSEGAVQKRRAGVHRACVRRDDVC